MLTRAGVCVTAALLVACVSIRAQEQILTLAGAVYEALSKNDRILNQHDSIDEADLGLRSARNAFQPKVVPNVRMAS